MPGSYLESPAFQREMRALLDQQQRGRGRTLPAELPETALLIVDMQTYFLDPASHAYVPGAEATLAACERLAESFATARRPVLLTRHLNTAANAGMLARWWADSIRRRSPLSRVHPRLAAGGFGVLEKSQYDAFHGTRLATRLRRRRIRRLVIAGVVTHLCCETTARTAFVRGFEVILATDATAAYAPEFHLGSLRNLAHGFATLATTAEIEAALAPVPRGARR
ncbi:MAG: isochorismatase family protein [Candidatus Eisenbacteria bacterium]|nr:isochorismatase family protein [Candidatus Eisenbacteria bacterium]